MLDKRRRVRLQDAEEKFLQIPGVREEYESRYAGAKAIEMIRTLREKAELSQQELAEICGFKQSAISRLENKVPKLGPTFETLARVAKACGRKIRVRFEMLSLEEKEGRNTPMIIAEYPNTEIEDTDPPSSDPSMVFPTSTPSASSHPGMSGYHFYPGNFGEVSVPIHMEPANPERQTYYTIPSSHVESILRKVLSDALLGHPETDPRHRVEELTQRGMDLLAEDNMEQRLSTPHHVRGFFDPMPETQRLPVQEHSDVSESQQ